MTDDDIPEKPEHGDGLTHTWYKEEEDQWWGKDDHGEFPLNAGSTEPVYEGEDVNYVPCNQTLKFTQERYAEVRYCKGMAEVNFDSSGSQFCKHHRGYENIMEQHEENYKTGAFVKSHKHLLRYLDAHERIVAVEMFGDLLEQSIYDFDTEDVQLKVPTEESDLTEDSALYLDFPLPSENVSRGQALWYAALDFVRIQNMHEEQFRVAAEETHEGRDLAVGERTTVVTVTEEGREITDTDEHHLNLPLSRIQKDYERHLQFGGVTIEEDDDSEEAVDRTFVVEMDTPTTEETAIDEEDVAPITELGPDDG